jgi:hypothetical protein
MSGILHVAPPFELLAAMVTLRLHIDAVPVTNAPLLIAPGSHKLGRIAESDVRQVVRPCGAVACLAEPGDIWLYAKFSTPQKPLPSLCIAVSYKSILPSGNFLAAWSG